MLDKHLLFLGTSSNWVGPASAFLVTALAYPPFIRFLKAKQFGQSIREEGPESHKKKKDTPTAGGICFGAVFLAGVLFACAMSSFAGGAQFDWFAMLLVGVTGVLCGAVGLIDDMAKVQHKANKGISAKARLIAEFNIGLLLGLVLAFGGLSASALKLYLPHIVLPFSPFLLVPFAAFLVAATTNATNLHDGMDGLAGGTAFLIFVTLSIMFISLELNGLAVVSATAAAVLLAYLLYNRYPAKIFMGDTGSLFVGGLMAALVLAGGLSFWFIPLSLIYIAETISVMIQVTVFKLTKPYTPERPMPPLALFWHKMRNVLPGEGKRFFRMAPLHHHFEAVLAERGVPEWQVVALFWLAQLVLCAAVLAVFLSTL